MIARLKEFFADVPRIAWFISGGIVLVAVVAGLTIIIFDALSRSYVTLKPSSPSLTHPDGLTAVITADTSLLKVEIQSIPRQVFMEGQAGRKWQAARDALPTRATLLSPVFTIGARGTGNVQGEMAIPNGADPVALLDLYQWNEDSSQWEFLPSEIDVTTQSIRFRPESLPITVIAAQAIPQPLNVDVVVEPGSEAAIDARGTQILAGLSIDGGNAMAGEPAAQLNETARSALLVANRGGVSDYVADAQRAIVRSQIDQQATAYDGVILDFDPGEGYTEFVTNVAGDIHAHGKYFGIVIRGDSLAGYDLIQLGQAIDMIWLAPGDDPTLFLPNGRAPALIEEAVRRVDRRRLGLWVNALNVDIGGGAAQGIGTDEALALFGDITPIEGYFDPNTPLPQGSDLPLRFSGQVASIGLDAAVGANYLTYFDERGQLHYVYFASAQSVDRQLEWAQIYGLGGVSVYGAVHPQAVPEVVAGIEAFQEQQPVSTLPDPLTITWRVSSESGANLDEQAGDLNLLQYLWKAIVDPGTYVISAGVGTGGDESTRGEVVVEVGEALPDGPTPTGTRGPQPTIDPNATPVPQPTQAPVTGSVAPGSFELGGQTHSLDHPNEMHTAGMTWVKFQHKWGPGDDPSGALGGRIQMAHANGFKVLLSIPGGLNPSSIDFDRYVNFVAGVAALGPDAIEIWNEMNLSIEWPVGQINGESYVNNMLAPAYQAIKAANPNVMVISGAPAPTGFFGGCAPNGCDDWFYLAQMRDAGAANYMDCMGMHYNAGATSPGASSGHPAGDHYTWYYDGMVNLYYGTIGKPLCITELGYVSGEGYGTLPANWSWASSVTVAQQAQWLAEAAVLSSQNGKVRLMVIFNVDIFAWGADPQGGYAIIRPGGGCPACQALAAVMP